MAMRADVLSSYALTLSRVLAWAGVSAIVFRRDGAEAFAVLALLRGTITLVGYTSLGLGPAMVRLMAEAEKAVPIVERAEADAHSPLVASGPDAGLPNSSSPPSGNPATKVLSYIAPAVPVQYSPMRRVYGSGELLAVFLFLFAALGTALYALLLSNVHAIQPQLLDEARVVVLCFGTGMAVRVATEPLSAALQVRGRLAVENTILTVAELSWLVLTFLFHLYANPAETILGLTGVNWMVVMIVAGIARSIARHALAPDFAELRAAASWPVMRRLLGFGVVLVIAQLADFLYAPTDYILINRLLTPDDLAAYAPTVQIDAALLLIVSGLSLALFPHAALAHAAGDVARVRRMYVQGTLVSAAGLVVAGGAAWLIAPWLFRVWLGEDLPAARAILPWVLVSTIVGGSSAVGRSVLLGMGRVKAFTASVLIAGVANVVLSVLFAAGLGLGLKGIVWGTTVVVVARCGIWMPWYVLRAMRHEESTGAKATDQ